MLRTLVTLALSVAAWCQTESAEQVFGPFTIGDQSLKASVSAASLRIQDSGGVLHLEKNLPDQTKVCVARISGKNGAGLLLAYETASAPRGRSWELLGIKEGKLASFGLPIAPEGDLESGAGQEATASWDAALQADVINFRIWTGSFFVLVPLELNWAGGNARLAYGLVRNCRMTVKADRKPIETQGTVRLFTEMSGEPNEAEEVVVTKSSAVEVLEAVGRVLWEESDDLILLDVAENIWLKVQLDGKEGYLHSAEDFEAIGLPESY